MKMKMIRDILVEIIHIYDFISDRQYEITKIFYSGILINC